MKGNNKDKKNCKDGNSLKELGLYIHIPFCVKKCAYCDFLSAPASEATKKRYMDSLMTEIRSYSGKADEYLVQTIFIGGGTPSSLDTGYIEEMMRTLKQVFRIKGINDGAENMEETAEISIEVNPGTLNKEKLEGYLRAGINRLSFGLQSTDNEELKLLGRIHTYEQFEENFLLAREVGFHNINIDLMSALPGQTVKAWETTLEKVVLLKPEHISAYSLIIEEGTPFYARYEGEPEAVEDKELLPGEETDRLIYVRTKEILEANDYCRYEISNYAKEGFQCKHNTSYWIGTEYLGLGLGASSLIDNARFHNLSDLEEYSSLCEQDRKDDSIVRKRSIDKNKKNGIIDDSIGLRRDIERLTESGQMEEFMFLGLRMCQGVNKEAFKQRFTKSIETIYGVVINKLIKEELLAAEGDRLYLTDYGIDVSNIVLARFLLE